MTEAPQCSVSEELHTFRPGLADTEFEALTGALPVACRTGHSAHLGALWAPRRVTDTWAQAATEVFGVSPASLLALESDPSPISDELGAVGTPFDPRLVPSGLQWLARPVGLHQSWGACRLRTPS